MLQKIKKIFRFRLNQYKNYKIFQSSIKAPDKFQGTKIHFGCGDVNLNGWINVDLRLADHIAINSDNLSMFKENSVDVIYMCHVLEHMSYQNITEILEQAFFALKKSGLILISVPDFDKLISFYEETGDINSIQSPLHGGQDYDLNIHKISFTTKSLSEIFDQIGFKGISNWETNEFFGFDNFDWSSKKIKYKSLSKNISLNLYAKK